MKNNTALLTFQHLSDLHLIILKIAPNPIHIHPILLLTQYRSPQRLWQDAMLQIVSETAHQGLDGFAGGILASIALVDVIEDGGEVGGWR